ncbi:serine protease [Streptomyces sp. ISL-86]|uniref:trypsin-like serine peptidase n=1 Tax=Streptomyces sp. ISL-86 TaxID=2819187 RepID=UPI001BEC43BF|nr:trypsin-like serine protease [Streptomyces sp. ISL-86]MBT2454119.1 trypsin-like serine protease [Streptomyces sp. ISL-86]
MSQPTPSRPAPRIRARRTSRILPTVAAMALLVSVDMPDAEAVPPLGVTARAVPDATADRVGALFADGLDGGHFCTAAVVHSDGRDVIATAAHCLDDPRNTVFAPGYRDGTAPYGLWRLTSVYAAPAWTDGEDPDADIAFATVAPVDGGQPAYVEDAVGGFPVAPELLDRPGESGQAGDPGRAGQAGEAGRAGDPTVTVLGYPSSQDTPLRCTNTTTLVSATQRRIDCPDLSGGTSGSPWLVDGALTGVLGGYQAGGTVPEVSYSAVMGDQALELYREAAVSG